MGYLFRDPNDLSWWRSEPHWSSYFYSGEATLQLPWALSLTQGKISLSPCQEHSPNTSVSWRMVESLLAACTHSPFNLTFSKFVRWGAPGPISFKYFVFNALLLINNKITPYHHHQLVPHPPPMPDSPLWHSCFSSNGLSYCPRLWDIYKRLTAICWCCLYACVFPLGRSIQSQSLDLL